MFDELGEDNALDRTVISTTPDVVEESPTTELARAAVLKRRRRRNGLLAVGLLLGVVAVLAAASLIDTGDDSTAQPTTPAESAAQTSTAPAPARARYAAEIRAGDPVPIGVGLSGTVTSFAPAGERLDRGDAMALVDGQPLVVFYGDEPFTRALRVGDEGGDVEQLEANLAALGFVDGGAMSVDTTYTRATANAVAAWEDSIGIARTGTVPLGRVLAVPGPVTVMHSAEPGTPLDDTVPVATVMVRRFVHDVVQPGSGILTRTLEVGAPVVHGDTLHLLGDLPVLAVTEPSEFVSTILDPLRAGDITALESALVFFGYDPDGVIVIDEVADLATLAAFGRWQQAVGLPETLAVGADYFVEIPDGMSVVASHLTDGDAIDDGALAYTLDAPALGVVAEIPSAEVESFAVGDVVDVELDDGALVEAAVVSIAEEPAEAGAAGSVVVDLTVIGDPEGVVPGPVTVVVVDAP